MTNLTAYFSGWVILAVVVVGLALYRKFISAHEEDHYVHMTESELKMVPHQVAVNRKIMLVERLGETLTLVTLIAGIALACIYIYMKLQ